MTRDLPARVVREGACTTSPLDDDGKPVNFFPDITDDHKPAMKVCASCNPEVRILCLEYAISQEIWEGIWGGLTPRMRRHLTRPMTTPQSVATRRASTNKMPRCPGCLSTAHVVRVGQGYLMCGGCSSKWPVAV